MELRPREILVVAPLLAAIIFLGVWPASVTSRTSPPWHAESFGER
jgi:NADH:ubiquinone oxidoreductase subunit 4 (subunit M)